MDRVFEEGIDARDFQLPRTDCPYPQESDEREEWEAGWDEEDAIASEEDNPPED